MLSAATGVIASRRVEVVVTVSLFGMLRPMPGARTRPAAPSAIRVRRSWPQSFPMLMSTASVEATGNRNARLVPSTRSCASAERHRRY
jgi:hypothetical protein